MESRSSRQPRHLRGIRHGVLRSAAGTAEVRVSRLRHRPPMNRLVTRRQELHYSCRFVRLV